MITEERVLDFIRSFGVDRGSEALHMIEKEAVRDDVPIIRKETGELLRILLQIKKPERILEVGAAIGFSSVFMGENTGKNTHITTIENYPPRIDCRRCGRSFKRIVRKLGLYFHGCGKGTIHSFYAGSDETFSSGRNLSVR